jgi:hypothetical protein
LRACLQTITITGITGGTFKLWVQDMYPTTDLTLASTTSEIASALTAAANMLALNDIDVECNSFSVSKALFQSNTAIQLNITFVVNNEMPLSHTTAYVDDLTGKPVTAWHNESCLLVVLCGWSSISEYRRVDARARLFCR